MKPRLVWSALLAVAFSLPIIAANASAAMIGGVASAFAGGGGFGSCSDTKLVPLDTVQDAFTLSVSTACLGESASVDMRADAATALIGLKASSNSGPNFSAQAGGEVGLVDRWIFSFPASVPTGFLTIPVSFTLDGTVAPGSTSRFSFFMQYNFSMLGQGFSQFQQAGNITSPGVYAETFSGTFRLINPGPGLGTVADVEMELFIPGLESGSIDFYNTGSISLELPEGVSVTTSSGVPLNFARSSAVPEPATWMLLAFGFVGVLMFRLKQARTSLL